MPWVILAASLLLLSVLGLVTWLLWKVVKRLLTDRSETQHLLAMENSKTQNNLLSVLTTQQELTKNLLDRMMSKDLQTYAAMTTLNSSLTTSNDEYINRSDAAEVERLANFAGVVPVGDTVYTENDAAEGLIGEIGLGELTELAVKLSEQD